jgi:phosphoribosylaminoimidazolecarboxamide formyltransferase/IMP cyclohydrolase
MKSKKFSKWALFSLSDTSHAIKFGKKLQNFGWNIIATNETLPLLKKEKINCISINEFTEIHDEYDFPPTLHPTIEMALTGKGSKRIDLVYDIPYSIKHGNDVGGFTLLALAVKGGRIPVMTHEDMKRVLDEFKTGSKFSTNKLLQELYDKTSYEIANHYLKLRASFSKNASELVMGKYERQLLNGENPYQKPCILFKTNNDDLGLTSFKLHSNVSPCFTNMADFESILETLTLLTKTFFTNYGKIPFISVASKHGNPCGIAVNWKIKHKTIIKALYGNPLAIWSGEFICNFKIDEKTAKMLIKSSCRKKLLGDSHWLLDVIVAPSFSNKALKLLAKRKNRKIFSNPNLQNFPLRLSKWSYRHVRGGFIKQPHSDYILSKKNISLNTKPLTNHVFNDMLIAWAASFTSFHGGNEVAIAKNGSLLTCAGGPSTVQAVSTAIQRIREIGHNAKNSVFAADAFFSFTDAPKLLVKTGCAAGVVPLGSKRDKIIKKIFFKHKVKMLYLANHIRGFCRH